MFWFDEEFIGKRLVICVRQEYKIGTETVYVYTAVYVHASQNYTTTNILQLNPPTSFKAFFITLLESGEHLQHLLKRGLHLKSSKLQDLFKKIQMLTYPVQFPLYRST